MSYGQPPQGYGYGPPQHSPQGYGYAPQRFPPDGPRDHPSATSALVLGLFGAFCLGALLGVPAIVMGRNVVRAVHDEPHRWRNAGSAKIGIVLGWVSVVETAFGITMLVTHGFAAAIVGMVAALIGLTLLGLGGATKLPAPIAAVSGRLRKTPLAVGLPLAGVLAGSAFGLLGAIGTAQGAARQCAEGRAKYAQISPTQDFGATRMAIDVIERTCNGAAPEVGAMRRDVDAKEANAKKRNEDAERARQAQLAAEKEKSAVANFPEASKSIAATIRLAQSKASQGRFEESQEALHTAERNLEDFKSTSVEQTKEYADLAKQITDKRRAIQPQLDRIADKRRKEQQAVEEKARVEEAAAALLDTIRGKKPVNSAWDGSVSEVKSYLKGVMHDPSSYEHVRTTEPMAEGEYWTVISSFRGKNAFGGLILNTKKFYIQQGQVVKVADVR